MATYKIVRFYQDSTIASHTIMEGLTLDEAQEHCRDPETSSRTCKHPDNVNRTIILGDWFDGYTEE